MSIRRVGGYLEKLRGLYHLGESNASGLSEHLGIGYETARTALRRLEAAGYVRSMRQRGKARTETVTYTATEKGLQAIAEGVEIDVPSDGYVPVSEAEGLAREDIVLPWQDLHEALGMGRPVMLPAQVVDRGMDVEPAGRWSA